MIMQLLYKLQRKVATREYRTVLTVYAYECLEVVRNSRYSRDMIANLDTIEVVAIRQRQRARSRI